MRGGSKELFSVYLIFLGFEGEAFSAEAAVVMSRRVYSEALLLLLLLPLPF